MSPATGTTGLPASDGRRPWWWPDATDLGAMVGLCRCPSTRDDGFPPTPAGEPETGAGAATLAARLSGVLRTGC